jgi:hypothetical protein
VPREFRDLGDIGMGGATMAHRYSVNRNIKAPIDVVFRRISEVEEFAEVSEDVLEIEFLTESTHGVGTRFRETRDMNGRRVTNELEITELVEHDRVRFVSDAGGTIWDTVMAVSSKGDVTELQMTMDARPYKLMARIMNFVIEPMVTKAVTKDMGQLKEWCEAHTSGVAGGPSDSA